MTEISLTAITAIRRGTPKNVYDIQVKNNHNFIANGLVVHNCLVFQESVMALANKVAGFPMDETDEVRRAIMKRSISGGEAAKKKMQALEDSFINGCIKNGVPPEIAKKAYETICFMSGYGFNRSLYLLQPIDIYHKNGTLKDTIPLQRVQPGDLVMSYDEAIGKTMLTPVVAKHDHGVLDLVEVELTTGEKIKCTWDHKFRTQETREMLPLWLIQKLGLSIVVDDVQQLKTKKKRNLKQVLKELTM